MIGNRVVRQAFQTVFETIYPPQCLACGIQVMDSGGLCPTCFRDTHFVTGLSCDKCGMPLIGDSDRPELCDDCLQTARPWGHGRAALVYSGTGQRLVLGLKHGDRTDLSKPAALWMARACADILTPKTFIAPIPLHWTRFFKRRYNQSGLLAGDIARQWGHKVIPDLLLRRRKTRSLDGLTKDERFAQLQDSMHVNQRFRDKIAGADILLVDDVMTSGATFAAATEACFKAGAATVNIVALARVMKDA